MFHKAIILTIVLNIFSFCNIAFAETVGLNQEQSRIEYSLSCLGITFKKKSLPVYGEISFDKGKSLLKGLDMTANFTSKNRLFRKVINFDQYPYFKFSSNLEEPASLKNTEYIDLFGDLSFHGVTRKINVKLKNESKEDEVYLTGFITIKMTDFGLIPPKILFIPIDNVIKTKAELYARVLK